MSRYWHYRVIRKQGVLGLHEVYFDEDRVICSFSENPIHPIGEDLEELTRDVNWMLEALAKPVLDYDDLLKEVTSRTA